MRKTLATILAILILLAGTFYFFYVRGGEEPIIDETIDYEEQLGGKLAKKEASR